MDASPSTRIWVPRNTNLHVFQSFVQVWVTCEFYLGEQFLCRSCFIQPIWSEHEISINL